MLIVCNKEIPKELCDKIQENVFALKCKEHKKPEGLLYDIKKVGGYLKKYNNSLNYEERNINWLTNYVRICRRLHAVGWE